MRLELCAYSGFKIYPGRGKRLVKPDGKTLIFSNSKCERSFKLKKNPRKVRWTVLYRRKHKKGQEEEVKKRKTRKTVKYQKAYIGASVTDILAKRNQPPEVRKALREQAAIKNAKDKARAGGAAAKPGTAGAKKAAAPKAQKTTHAKAPIAKPVQTKAPRVGGKR